MSHKSCEQKINLIGKKRSGSMMVSLLIVLSVIMLISATVYQIKMSNTKQYQLIQQAYTMELMSEMTILQIKKELTTKQQDGEIRFPKMIQFNSGKSQIQYDTKKEYFTIDITLNNGISKQILYQLDIEKEKIEIDETSSNQTDKEEKPSESASSDQNADSSEKSENSSP